MFYVRRDTRILGPVTGREFAVRLQSEQIRWTDEVATARQGPFVVIAEYPELDDVFCAAGLRPVTVARESIDDAVNAKPVAAHRPVLPPVSGKERGRQGDRPASVTLAVRLLWAWLWLGLLQSVLFMYCSDTFSAGVRSFAEAASMPQEQARIFFSILTVVFMVVGNGLLVLGIKLLEKRHKWVCYVLWTLSILLVIGMPFNIYQLWNTRTNPYSFAACVAVAVAAGGVQVAASIALLQRTSAGWFGKPTP
ncbi:MAG: hypothetical protein VB858_05275 [Planctomycetaceae bacterium]